MNYDYWKNIYICKGYIRYISRLVQTLDVRVRGASGIPVQGKLINCANIHGRLYRLEF